ncbi:MAG: hypothetical protein EPO63_05775 [Candidatus Nitrosotenuis sp.]|nr:MAG: hypothetical protein EPO63_05775 [Candidatus Nitrosotenuis sp.]
MAEQLPYFLSNNLLLNHKNYCHDYVVQITDAREDGGGMAGSPNLLFASTMFCVSLQVCAGLVIGCGS